MSNKKKKLSEFDFSVKGAHVALVTRAANGKTEPLIVKNFTADVEKGEYYEGDDTSDSSIAVKMSLADFLRVKYGEWSDTAKLIANSIKKAADGKPEFADLLKEIPTELLSEEEVRQAPVEQSTNTNQEDVTMSKAVETPEQVADVQKAAEAVALEKKVQEQAEILKAMSDKLAKFEEAEEIRKTAKFGAMADKYSAIGANEETAGVLKSLEGHAGFEHIVKMLDNAVDTLEKGGLLKATGEEGDSKPSLGSIDELKDIAKNLMAGDKNLTIQKALVVAAKQNPHLVK